MTFTAVLLASALAPAQDLHQDHSHGHAHHHAAEACHAEGWRAELPDGALEAVERVDQRFSNRRLLWTIQNPSSLDQQTPPPDAAVDPEDKKKQEAHRKDVEMDIKLGTEYAAEVAKELQFSEDAEKIARVEKMGKELAAIANSQAVEVTFGDPRLSVFPYQFKVVKGKDVNAFSIPGGFIYIYEGLIDYAESDDELAGVVAHEISHAAFRHLAELRRRASRVDLLQIPLILAAILTRSPDALVGLQGANLAGQAFKSGWSLDAELSADYGAMQYMVQSGYNPVGTLTFMERLAYRDQGGPQIDWGILASHPPSKERAQAMLKFLNERNIPVRRSQVTTSLRASTKIGDEGAIELWFGKMKLHAFRGENAIVRSEDAVKRLNTFFDRVPGLEQVGRHGYTIRGSGRPLFEVSQQDMEQGQDLDLAFADVINRMRSVTFDLNYRLWNQKDSK